MADKAYRMLTKGGTVGHVSGRYRTWQAGQVLLVPEGEFRHLRSESYEPAEQAAEKPQAKAEKRNSDALADAEAKGAVEPEDAGVKMKHVGGGWYLLPDGEKVHGKQAALDAMED